MPVLNQSVCALPLLLTDSPDEHCQAEPYHTMQWHYQPCTAISTATSSFYPKKQEFYNAVRWASFFLFSGTLFGLG